IRAAVVRALLLLAAAVQEECMPNTPTFVAKKIGDQYVIVPKNPPATAHGCTWCAGGVLFTLYGVLRGRTRGLLYILIGAGMLYRGATGHNPLAWLIHPDRDRRHDDDTRQSPSHQNDVIPHAQTPKDQVDEASMESFP